MRVFGDIEGTSVGQIFENRLELAKAGIHPPSQAGISGSAKEGADSIVLSGGYEDDEDFGDVIIYTGAGGRDTISGKQIKDQELKRSNLALAKSKIDGYPIRVTRSYKHQSIYSPQKGYQYSGLFFIDDYWSEIGRSNHKIWRFRLVSYGKNNLGDQISEDISEYDGSQRKETTIQRVVRDTQKAKDVKILHNYECQVCGVALKTSAGPYAEAAHIKPLGQPHCGPDVKSNILCLCPNHHVMFDNGGFTIADDLTLIGITGKLKTIKKHEIGGQFLAYHREHYQIHKNGSEV